MALLATQLGIEEVRAHRTWFLCLGAVLIVIGVIAIGSTELMTMVSVILLGWLLIFGYLFSIAQKERGLRKKISELQEAIDDRWKKK